MKTWQDMTDRELLELAAKAAGYEYAKHGGYIVVDGIPGNWNPLTDDGDALRLAVTLHLTVSVGLSGSTTVTDAFRNPLAVIKHDNDPDATTRRAIVRAAVRLKLEGT